MTEISENCSKRITSLRFFLMLLVMIKHNTIVKGIFMKELPFSEAKIVTFIKEFFANGLGELAVPVFFIFSAFLLFSSEDSYFRKVKKRLYSIILPYTIWTVFYFVAWLLLKKIGLFTGFENPCLDWRKWNVFDYLKRFFGYYHGLRFTFVGSFWFLRDLMILVFISPFLLFCTKKIPLLTMLFILLSYFFNILPPLLMNSRSLFYFEIGLILAIHKIDFFDFCDKVPWADLFIAFLGAFIAYSVRSHYGANGALKKSISYFLFVISGIVMLLKFTRVILERAKFFNLTKKLAPYTFCCYALHSPVILEVVKKLTFKILPYKSIVGGGIL